VLNAGLSVLLIQMHDSFSIAFGAIAMPLRFKVFAEFLMIVDFTVEDNPEALVFIRDWLMTSLNVDNAEPAHGQSDILFEKEAFIVGPAVRDAPVHTTQRIGLYMPVTIREENAADSTHIRLVSLRTGRHWVWAPYIDKFFLNRSHVGGEHRATILLQNRLSPLDRT